MKRIVKIFLINLILFLLLLLYLIFFYKVDINKYAWYNKNEYIGHAFYGIDGLNYINSSEALEYGYAKGIRVMETDLIYTSDNKIVVNHNWDISGALTYTEFMNSKLYDKYSPVDLEILINYMKKYDDLYIVIDTKEENYSGINYLNIYKELIEYCKKIDVKLLDRIIIQIYDYDMYNKIDDMYNFDNYIFSLYKFDDFNLFKLIYFCLYNKIDVIVIPEWLIENGSIKDSHIDTIKSKNLKIYVHTVNDRNKYMEYLDKGIDGIYTDFLY